MKGKGDKRVMRQAMLFGFETVALTKRQEAELKMLRFFSGVTKMDEIKNEHIRGTEQVGRFGANLERPD